MTYCCEDCGFLFSRVSEVQICPYCEGKHFRHATQEETAQLLNILDRETKQNRSSVAAGEAET